VRVCPGDLPRESPALLFLLSFLAWHGGAELIPFSCGSDCPSPHSKGAAPPKPKWRRNSREEKDRQIAELRDRLEAQERERRALSQRLTSEELETKLSELHFCLSAQLERVTSEEARL
jgi:hypothetical protein